jgi:DNA-binding transcriptional ArsR family regulator
MDANYRTMFHKQFYIVNTHLNPVGDEAMQSEASIKKLSEWADSFKSVSNPIRLAILFMLYGSEVLTGRAKSLTFGQIKEILGLPDNTRATSNLSYHISELIDAGFIEKEPFQAEKGTGKVQVIYHLSSRGHKFLSDFNVAQVIEEKLKKQNNQ